MALERKLDRATEAAFDAMSTDLRGHSTNLVGLPTGLLASADYNAYPVPLRLAGVRETNRSLFNMLMEAGPDAFLAAKMFQDYMDVVFGLDPELRVTQRKAGARREYRSGYLRLLKGWMFDSNNPEGAVLKGWVESRFGLFPTYHKEPIQRFNSEAWLVYVAEKMSSRFHNNAIHDQLDLLYEFCQWCVKRLHFAGRRQLTLYRGTNDFDEHQVIARPAKRQAIVRLNSLVSFTPSRDIAGEFGDYILEARVPVTKIVFFRDLLPRHALQGEGEFLVIGGDYRVRIHTF